MENEFRSGWRTNAVAKGGGCSAVEMKKQHTTEQNIGVTLLLPLAAVTRATKAMLVAIRRINTVAEQTARLTRFSLQPPKYVEVEFSNGNVFKLSAEFLRINSPAVDGKIRSIGGEK
ncbi:hypothetical protein TSUD_130110, partial [Trifolium subterraneum]